MCINYNKNIIHYYVNDYYIKLFKVSIIITLPMAGCITWQIASLEFISFFAIAFYAPRIQLKLNLILIAKI